MVRKEGELIIWELAQRKGDSLLIGKDMLDHMVNLFQIGEEERRRFARVEKKKRHGVSSLWDEHLLLLDRFGNTILQHAKKLEIELDAEGWQRLTELSKELDTLSRAMTK